MVGAEARGEELAENVRILSTPISDLIEHLLLSKHAFDSRLALICHL